MRVAILFDDVSSRPDATPDEKGVLEAVQAVEEVLEGMGHRCTRVPAGKRLTGWIPLLRKSRPHLVFNLCEGLGGRSEGEVLAARVVEEMGIPLTGSQAAVLSLARRKDKVNALLRGKGLPVPDWALWDGRNPEAFVAGWTSFPAIVKPAAEDASVGITQESVVHDSEGLARQLGEMAWLAPLLVQLFVGTREINAGIVGGNVLPLAEILFGNLPGGHHPIVDYAAKWVPGSPEDLGTRPVCPAPLSAVLASRIRLLALRAWRAVGGRGYGRVDFRLADPDELYILEVNPNPDLSPGAGLARAAAAEGWDYGKLVRRIVASAIADPEVAA